MNNSHHDPTIIRTVTQKFRQGESILAVSFYSIRLYCAREGIVRFPAIAPGEDVRRESHFYKLAQLNRLRYQLHFGRGLGTVPFPPTERPRERICSRFHSLLHGWRGSGGWEDGLFTNV